MSIFLVKPFTSLIKENSIFRNGETLYHYNTENAEQPRYWTADDFTLEPFTERFDNTLAGWTLNLPIVIEWVYDTCNIPT